MAIRTMPNQPPVSFDEAEAGLMAGDFSRLAPLFGPSPNGGTAFIIQGFDDGLFAGKREALNEAFTCACFNGCTSVVEHLLANGVDPSGGIRTGLNAFHWAANRGQLQVVESLIRNHAPLEVKNSYGGSVLGCAVWSAVHEPKPDHPRIVESLLRAGANALRADYPCGDPRIDEILRRYRPRE
jgi:hypothetical protein